MIRQTTMMRYGVLMANRDMKLPTVLRAESAARRDHLGLNLVAVLEPGARADHDVVAFLQVSGSNFNPLRGLDA